MPQYAALLVAIFKLSALLAFRWYRSHLLALLRYEEKLNRALMKFLLKTTFITKFSQNLDSKCPFFDRKTKKDFWQK